MRHIHIVLAAGALLVPGSLWAQQEKTNDFRTDDEKGLVEEIFKIEKKTDKFNLFRDMHADFDAGWTGCNFDEGKFRFQQLRLCAGQIDDFMHACPPMPAAAAVPPPLLPRG